MIDLLKHGELRGYMLSWFGGIPIFYFYAPLPFWLMGLVAVIFPFLSSALIFKWFLLLELALTPVAFYFFVRSFFPSNKSYACLSLVFGLAYLFYQPYEYGSLGIGVAGAIPVGLFAETLAISFVLIFLGFFKKFLAEEQKKILSYSFFGTLIFGTLIVYSHILSIVFAAFFAVLIFLFYLNWANLKKLGLLILSLFITCAYALYPLFAHLGFSSGWRMDNKGYFNDPLAPLLAFDLSNLTLGNYLNFNWVWFIIFVFFLVGLIRLFKTRQFILPTLFLTAFILVPRQYFQMIFPTLPIHYYRIMPFIILIYLAIGVFGASELFTYLAKKKRIISYGLGVLLLAVLTVQIYSFSFLNDGHNIQPRIIDSYMAPIEYYDNLGKYQGGPQAKRIMKYFYDNKIKSRVIPEMSSREFTMNLGSSHYFNTFMPLVNNTPVLFGLYAESSYEMPFFFTPLQILSDSSLAYGNVLALMADQTYLAQKPEDTIKELSLFNAEYFIAASSALKNSLAQATSSVEKINLAGDNTPFEIYKIKNVARGYLSNPQYRPALYINEDNQLTFRDFSLGWFKVTSILDFPVIFGDDRVKNIKNINLSDISFLIIHAAKLSSEEIKSLEATGKKVVILAQEKYQGAALPPIFILIEDFKPGAAYYGQALIQQPNYEALKSLEAIFKNEKATAKINDQPTPSILTWQDEKIVFQGRGPVIINAAYFPNWRSLEKGQKVYQVTPVQMLVFANGETTLNFSAGWAEKISGWLSFAAIIFLLGLVVRRSLTRKS